MKWNEVFRNTFKALRSQTSAIRHQVDFILPSMPMVEACRADDFDFFEPFIAAGKLTVEQMRHATERYYLGKTKGGKTIFWMIDDMLQPLDAHIGATWISKLLKVREPLLEYWQVQHCLFGLHLLMEEGRGKMEDGRRMREEGRGKMLDVLVSLNGKKQQWFCRRYFQRVYGWLMPRPLIWSRTSLPLLKVGGLRFILEPTRQ